MSQFNKNKTNELQTNNNLFVSLTVYSNAEVAKQLILADTLNKAGIYL